MNGEKMLKLFCINLCFFASAVFALETPTDCQDVHVWYQIKNESDKTWRLEISTINAKNLRFIDEKCQEIGDNGIEIQAGKTALAGMQIKSLSGFTSLVLFSGIEHAQGAPHLENPRLQKKCIIMVEAYGPAMMNKMDWNMNNSDCYSKNQNSEIYLK